MLREFLFPGQKSDVVSSKSVARRLTAHVGNPVRYENKTFSLYAGADSHSKTKTFFVSVVTDMTEGMAA